MEREGEGGRQRGFFVAFGYSRDSEQECAAFHKRTGRENGTGPGKGKREVQFSLRE